MVILFPRALPWAVMLRPVGAEESGDFPCPPQQLDKAGRLRFPGICLRRGSMWGLRSHRSAGACPGTREGACAPLCFAPCLRRARRRFQWAIRGFWCFACGAAAIHGTGKDTAAGAVGIIGVGKGSATGSEGFWVSERTLQRVRWLFSERCSRLREKVAGLGRG